MDFGISLLFSLLAGLSTVVGGMLVFFVKPKFKYLCIAMGFSAGVMIFISFVELLTPSMASIGFLYASISFFAGIIAIYMIDTIIPHVYGEEKLQKKSRLKRMALLIFIGIAIHNFPEGMAVFFSSMSSIKLGLLMAFAVALHNIPEGIAVSMPIFYATKSKAKSVYYSFLTGIAEPIGAVISFLFLYQFLNDFVLGVILSAVAGIMIFISFDELLPFVYKREGLTHHLPILGLFLGMLVMSVSIYMLA
jgi:zinc transporter, ZIP family